MTLTYRWLGVAGLEFSLDGYTLLIDPHFTRPSKAALISAARVRSNEALTAKYAPCADAVLVTHPHYDHILDVPGILRRTGARGYGTPNTCELLALHGIPDAQTGCLNVGDQLALGPFSVEVFPARHTPIPLARLYNGALPGHLRRARTGGGMAAAENELPPGRFFPIARNFLRRGSLPPGAIAPALRLSDYRMDACYSFRLKAGEVTLLVGNHPFAADILFMSPYHPGNYLETMLRAVNPWLVVPIHWDDFTRPLSLPLLPMLLTPAQAISHRSRLLQRMDLEEFTRTVQAIQPGVEVRVPKIFEMVEID